MTKAVAKSPDFRGQHSLHRRADPISQLIISQFQALEDYDKNEPTYAS